MVEIPEKFRDIIYGGPPRQEEKGHLRGTLSNPNFNHLAISQLRAGMYRILPNAGSVAKHQPRGAWPNFPGHEWSCDHHLHRASQFANSPPQCRGILQLLPSFPFVRSVLLDIFHFSCGRPPTLLATWFGVHLLLLYFQSPLLSCHKTRITSYDS